MVYAPDNRCRVRVAPHRGVIFQDSSLEYRVTSLDPLPLVNSYSRILQYKDVPLFSHVFSSISEYSQQNRPMRAERSSGEAEPCRFILCAAGRGLVGPGRAGCSLKIVGPGRAPEHWFVPLSSWKHKSVLVGNPIARLICLKQVS